MPQGNEQKIKILVVGAGTAGRLIARNIAQSNTVPFEVVGYVDDDPAKQHQEFEGAKVLGTIEDTKKLVQENGVEELFIALPSERGRAIRRVVDQSEGLRVAYKILPRDSEVLLQSFNEDFLKLIRRVRPEDLLGGEIVKSDQENIISHLSKEVVMITGAAGSIGSELSRQVSLYNAKKVIFYDWWENGMFELRNELLELRPNGDFEFVIGDVKDRKRVNAIMKKFNPTTVFHAAAYKHVPLMEHNASEAIKNNILGTKTVAEIAIQNGVKKFVLVSTDKAVNPTNIMGATKRTAEKIIHVLSESQDKTTFCAVRFGNVINSNGSAIPFFERQIEKGGPVTVTHKEITRFFMTIPEACNLILKAWIMGENNDLFVLDMGEPVKIYDLARLLVILQGYVPDEDIKIDIIGLRPGEKLYEEVLVSEEEVKATPVEKIFRTQNYMNYNTLEFMHELSLLIEEVSGGLTDASQIKQHIKKLVPTYKPKED